VNDSRDRVGALDARRAGAASALRNCGRLDGRSSVATRARDDPHSNGIERIESRSLAE
jgi:hypothetical protein